MQKTILLSFSILIANLAYSQNERSQEAIITDRPDLTESSRTVPHHSLQFEAGLLMFVNEPTSTSEFKNTLYQLPAVLARFGLFKNVELRLFNQFVNEKNSNPTLKEKSVYGIDNLQIGTKINLLTEKGLRPEIALISHVVFPLGSEQFKNDKTLINFVFSLSHSLSEKFSLGYNLGWTSDNINANGTGLYTLAVGYSITSKLGFYAEGYGVLKNLETATLGIDGGFTYLLNSNIQLDISAGKGLTENNHFFSAGFSWLLPEVF